jgi:hypothetical protein
MELPITRPSMISYADELNFNELLGELKSKKYNGFIRITAGSQEGHILFKKGIQIAASYDKDSKIDAINKIKSATDNSSTLVEVFDLRDSQVNYLKDINKAYLFTSGSEVDNKLEELKKTRPKEEIESPLPEKKSETIETPLHEEKSETIETPLHEEKSETIETPLPEKKQEIIKSPLLKENESFLPEIKEIKEDVEGETEVSADNENVRNKLKSISQIKSDPVKEPQQEVEIKPNANISHEVNAETKVEEIEAESINRAELMKKYGLKDVGEEEVENILESYKGGSLSDEDIEKIELTLMNKIKKSILSIPKIKGAEVMVFLENASELTGTINIITEYESKGFLSRFMGESKDLDNLKKQIINITQIEIKKSFRGYPEIVDNFKINVEVS